MQACWKALGRPWFIAYNKCIKREIYHVYMEKPIRIRMQFPIRFQGTIFFLKTVRVIAVKSETAWGGGVSHSIASTLPPCDRKLKVGRQVNEMLATKKPPIK